MNKNKKVIKALTGLACTTMLIGTTPAMAAESTEINITGNNTSQKIESTLIASATDLGSDVIVTIPNVMTLTYNADSKQLERDYEVHAKGIVGVLDKLTVSTKSNVVELVNKNKKTDKISVNVSFANNGTGIWTADNLIDGYKDESKLIKKQGKLYTNESNIKHIGDYQGVVDFDISLGDGINNWTKQAKTLFNLEIISSGDNAGTYKITGLTSDGETYLQSEDGAAGFLEIPEEIDGIAVTEIGDNAFRGCTNLTTINLPEGLTTLGNGTFADCTSLTDITIPSTLTDTPTNYNTAPFKNSGLVTATLAAGSTEVSSELFKDCSNLESVIIPKGVTKIEDLAFSNCTSLADINLPEGLTEIGNDAFKGCTSLSTINLPEGLTTLGNGTFADCTSLTDITIPSTLTDTPTNYNTAPFKNSGLVTATLAAGSTEVSSELFKDCSNLESVIIPKGVTKIEDLAFSNCTSLADINLPEGLTALGNSAFADCASLTDIIIPSTLTNTTTDWPYAPFKNSGLVTATLAAGSTEVSSTLFDQCSNLESVIIPEGVTKIEDYVFLRCANITSLTIPASVIDMSAESIFESCSGLVDIYYGGTIEAFNLTGFKTKSTSQTITIHCSNGDITVQ